MTNNNINLFNSNRLEKLIDIFILLLKSNGHSNNFFKLNPIITFSKSTEKYIEEQLATKLGISFNNRYMSIHSFIWMILHKSFENLPKNLHNITHLPQDNPYHKDIIKYYILDFFCKKEYQNIFSIDDVRFFDNYFNSHQTVIYDFCLELSRLFDEYLVYRTTLIEKWKNNQLITDDNEEGWQQKLWQYLEQRISKPNRAVLLSEFKNILSNPTIYKNLDFKKIFNINKIYIFGYTSIPPIYLDLIRELSNYIEINFLLLNPSQEYWTDTPKTFIDSNNNQLNLFNNEDYEYNNTLLQSLGNQCRDFFDKVVEINYKNNDSEHFQENNANNILSNIQNDILYDTNSKIEHISTIEDLKKDNSINIINAYSEIRELQVLKNNIISYLENNPNTKLNNIVVTSINIDKYIPFIDGIFGENSDDNINLKYNIVNTKINTNNDLISSIKIILDIIDSRFDVSTILPIFENKLILNKFSLNNDDIELIKQLIVKLNIHWGWDKNTRKKYGGNDNFFTWKQAIERIFLGLFLEEKENYQLYENIAPYYSDINLIDNLTNFLILLESIGNIQKIFNGKYTIEVWITKLIALVEEFIYIDQDNLLFKNKYFDIPINDILILSKKANFDTQINFIIFKQIIDSILNVKTDIPIFQNGIIFCNISAMRSIPYDYIAILGMNDKQFPRQNINYPFDLINKYPKKGDKSRREDDKYLFLETILSARHTLYLSYTGIDIKSGKELAPSSVINDLIDSIANMYTISTNELLTKFIDYHPLQPFSKQYFYKEYYNEYIFSYNSNYINAFKQHQIKINDFINFDNYQYKYQENENLIKINFQDFLNFWNNPLLYWMKKEYHLKTPSYQNINLDNEPTNIEKMKYLDIIYFNALEKKIDLNIVNNYLKQSSQLPINNIVPYQLKEKLQKIDNIYSTANIQQKSNNINFTLNLNNNITINGILKHLYEKQQLFYIKEDYLKYEKIEIYLYHLIANAYLGEITTIILDSNKKVELSPIQDNMAKQKIEKLVEYFLIGQKNPIPLTMDIIEEINKCKNKNKNSIINILNKELNEEPYHNNGITAYSYLKYMIFKIINIQKFNEVEILSDIASLFDNKYG